MRALKSFSYWDAVKERPLLFIIFGSVLIRLLYLLLDWPLWWDSHVYVSMGKYIFSQGETGIWEVYRPLLHPLILGAFWKAGINPFVMGKLLDILFTILSVYLIHIIGTKIFNEKIGLLSALIFSLNATLISLTGLILADPLALFLGLCGVYFILRQEKMWSFFMAGFFLALSFLTRFPYGIWFGSIFLCLFITRDSICFKKIIIKKMKNILGISLGFLMPVLPYLYFNYWRYRNPFIPFTSGTWIVTTATWFYDSGIFFYFREFFLGNPIYLFFFPAFYFFYKQRLWKDFQKKVVFLIPVLTLLYFIYLPRKEVRYLLVALPFFALTISYALVNIYERLKLQTKPVILSRAFVIICIILILLPTPTTLNIERVPTFDKPISTALAKHNIRGLVLSSSPSYISFLDNPIATLDGMDFAPERYERFQGAYKMLFINDCDFPCPPDESMCKGRKEQLLQRIERENQRIFRETYIFKEANETCTYSMYLPK